MITRNGYAVVKLTVLIQLENIKLEEREMSGQQQEDTIVAAINKKFPGLIIPTTLGNYEIENPTEIDVIELDYSD